MASAVALGFITLASVVGSPLAASSSTRKVDVTCTDELIASGSCMPFVMNAATTDVPELAAVEYGVKTYGIDLSAEFIEQNESAWSDATVEAAEEVIERAEEQGSLRRAAKRERPLSRSSILLRRTAVGPFRDTTRMPAIYGYCSSTCSEVGRFTVEMRTNLDPNLFIGGDVIVSAGPAVAIAGATCRVRYERNNFPDTTVKSWQTCADAVRPGSFSRNLIIFVENSSFYGTRGEKYHNDYSFRIDPIGAPPAIVVSDRTSSWKYPSGGGQPSFS